MNLQSYIHEPYGKFLKLLFSETVQEGETIANYVHLIRKATAWYILQTLWPEQYAQLKESTASVAYAVSEPGWKNKIENIQSELKLIPQPVMTLNKSFVMGVEKVLALVKFESEFVLVLFDRDEKAQNWSPRAEPETIYALGPEEKLLHYVVSCEDARFSGNYLPIKKRNLQITAMQAFSRERFGYAVLAAGLALHLRQPGVSDFVAKIEALPGDFEVPDKDLMREAIDFMKMRVPMLSAPENGLHALWAWLSRIG